MRIIFRNLREGVIKLKLEEPEDAWHLSKVIDEGTVVKGKTKRKTTIKRGQEIVSGDIRPVLLSIDVEKVSFQKDTGRLRLLGKIVEGPPEVQVSSYHTLQVEPGMVLAITKPWKKHEVKRLEDAAKPSPKIFICMIDRDAAMFYVMLPIGPRELGQINFQKTGRPGEEDNRDGFYKKILETIQARVEPVILAGPGFERENIFKFIKSKSPETAKRIVLEHTHDTEISGVNELLRKAGDEVLAKHRVSKETGWVEEFLGEIKKDGLAVYGPKETETAVDMGAVSALIVSEEKLSESEALMEKAEKSGAEIRIVSSSHEAGEMFLGMGGIGGILRYKTV